MMDQELNQVIAALEALPEVTAARGRRDELTVDICHIWIIQSNGMRRQIETRQVGQVSPDDLAARLVGVNP